LFRLNTELADELTRAKGTIGFTLLARHTFKVFREFSHNPSAIRLIVLILRQTNAAFTRPLTKLLEDEGWDVEHRARAVGQLRQTLERLQALDMVQAFEIDLDHDQVRITRNPEWYTEGDPSRGLAG
jgi:hypothetical protein